MNQYADVADLRGDTRLSSELRRTAAAVEAAARNGQHAPEPVTLQWLEQLPGLDPDRASRVLEVARATAEELRASLRTIPRDLRRLVQRAGMELADVAELHRRTGAVTAGDFAAIGLDRDRAELDPRTLHAVRHALDAGVLRQGRRLTLGRAYATARHVERQLRAVLPDVSTIFAGGSLRRMEETIGDLHLLGATARPREAIAEIAGLWGPGVPLHSGQRQTSVLVDDEEVTIRLVEPHEFGFAAIHYTGSREHLRALRRHASAKNAILTATRLIDSTSGRSGHAETEEEAYAMLGLAYMAPELRQDAGEIEAAAEGRLPRLVGIDEIRGDLHVHSEWSDGRDPVETMVNAARKLGYQYVAITDHSPSSASSRVLTVDRLRAQAAEIARLRGVYQDITILHGVEVDILPDGDLDFPDAILADLDIVLASLHDSAGHSDARLTERYLAAIRHPLVNVITHPANRLVGRRSGYELDWDAIFAAAAASGTALEVDGAPSHLDMDGAMARRAIAAGATIAIDSDCHRAEWLKRQMRFGVGMARRGWVEPHHALTTWPLSEVRRFVQRKRTGAGT